MLKKQIISVLGLVFSMMVASNGVAQDVVGILKAQTANEHGAMFANAIEAAGSARKDLDFVMNDAENDLAKQISQAETMINRGAKVLAIEPVSADGSQVIAEMAAERGAKVFTFNARFSDQSKASSFVGADNALMGRAQMEFTADKLGGKGNIVVLHGAMGHGAQVGREDGYKQVLAKFPGIKIVREGTAEWSADKAVTLMENFIQSGETINAVVAQNDDMAKGAAVAAIDAGLRDKIVVSGIDGLSFGVNLVSDGTIDLSVEQGTQCQVDNIISVAAALATGNPVESEILCDANLITKENVSEWKK